MASDSKIEVHHGDCLDVLRGLEIPPVDMAYLDPPFFTNKKREMYNRSKTRKFSFADSWASQSEYSIYLGERIEQVRETLADTGSIFVHCDRNATHVVRGLLDEIFGAKMFRSEIIWTYRRWSNSAKRLLPSHQTIYYYTKSSEYTFNTIWREYSPATNVEQILQKRVRDSYGRAIYKTDSRGQVDYGGDKPGAPLGDVWDLPYLNPKARERTGFPTQKPLTLLERVIEISTNEGDAILDPFCGSGTALVAAMLLGRRAIGIDIEADAVRLTRNRLRDPVKTESRLARQGRDSYRAADESTLALLRGLDYAPVQRNSGIDAIAKTGVGGFPVTIRVQRPDETLDAAINKLRQSSKNKGVGAMFVVATKERDSFDFDSHADGDVTVVDSAGLAIEECLAKLRAKRR